MQAKIILGIDPGIGRTGYGLISVNGIEMSSIAFGCITTLKNTPIPARLVELERDLQEIVERYKPDLVAVEELLFTKNVSTGIMVSEARGVILLTIEKAGIALREFTPPQIKLAVTGDGSADKRQVQDMVLRLLKLSARPKLDDAADALAVAICAAN